jgi:hypothetical protein
MFAAVTSSGFAAVQEVLVKSRWHARASYHGTGVLRLLQGGWLCAQLRSAAVHAT